MRAEIAKARTQWKFADGLDTARVVEMALVAAGAGWHVALAGGVMYRGHSLKDLDLVFFPHHSEISRKRDLRRVLRLLGWVLVVDARVVRRSWETGDRKHVEVWSDGWGRRIDAIIVGQS